MDSALKSPSESSFQVWKAVNEALVVECSKKLKLNELLSKLNALEETTRSSLSRHNEVTNVSAQIDKLGVSLESGLAKVETRLKQLTDRVDSLKSAIDAMNNQSVKDDELRFTSKPIEPSKSKAPKQKRSRKDDAVKISRKSIAKSSKTDNVDDNQKRLSGPATIGSSKAQTLTETGNDETNQKRMSGPATISSNKAETFTETGKGDTGQKRGEVKMQVADQVVKAMPERTGADRVHARKKSREFELQRFNEFLNSGSTSQRETIEPAQKEPSALLFAAVEHAPKTSRNRVSNDSEKLSETPSRSAAAPSGSKDGIGEGTVARTTISTTLIALDSVMRQTARFRANRTQRADIKKPDEPVTPIEKPTATKARGEAACKTVKRRKNEQENTFDIVDDLMSNAQQNERFRSTRTTKRVNYCESKC